MKLTDDVLEWCTGAEAEYGDASARVCQLFFRWVSNRPAFSTLADGAGQAELTCTADGSDLVLIFGPGVKPIPVPMVTGHPQYSEDGELEKFGAEKIAPGLWAISPSLHLPRIIHAFVVLYDVPDPGPWEKLIVLAAEMPRRRRSA